jgi:PAS domain S-box-containing protein
METLSFRPSAVALPARGVGSAGWRTKRLVTARGLLLRLLLAAQLPALVACALVAWLAYERERLEITQGTAVQTALLAREVDGRLQRVQSGLEQLARQLPPEGQGWSEWRRDAAAAARDLEIDAVVLVRSGGEQVVNTLQPEGAALAHTMPQPYLDVARTGRASVIDMMTSPATGRSVVAIGIPVVRADGLWAVHGIFDVQRLQSLLEAARLPPHWIGAIVDGQGRVMARAPDPQLAAGRRVTPEMARQLAAADLGTFEGRTYDGEPVVTSYWRSPATRWMTSVSVPRSDLLRPAWRSVAVLVGMLAVVLALSLGVAVRLQRHMTRSIRRLRDCAVGRENPDSVGELTFAEAEELAATLADSNQSLRDTADRLLRSERRLAAILYAARSAIVVTDGMHRVQLYNAAAQQTFRHAADGIMGTSIEPLFTPLSWRDYLGALDAAMHDGVADPVVTTVCRCVRLGGDVFPAEFSVASVRDADGAWMHTLSVRDITERVQHHQSLQRAQRETEQVSLRFERILLQEMDNRQAEIARELHDSMGSGLAGIDLLLESVRAATPASATGTAALLRKCQEQVRLVSERLRRISRGIMPVGSEAGALRPALEQFAQDFSDLQRVRCTLRVRGDFGDIAPTAAGHVYRIVQEAVANALRHGRASAIELRLARAADRCSLSVRDNGGGCDLALLVPSHPGLGFKSMRARARALGGKLTLRNPPGGGCEVYLRWWAEAETAGDAAT